MKPQEVKVLLLEGIHKNAVSEFERIGYTNIEYIDTGLSEEELLDKIKDVHILGIRSRTYITKEVLDVAENLLCIGCFCIGTNQVDTSEAQLRGIPVFNAPFSNTRSVAELTIASIIHLMRGIPEKNAAAHKGVWKKSAKNSFEVRKKNLGIIGYGNIGSQVSVLASALGIHVYYYDTEHKLQHGNARAVDSLDLLLEVSDVITLHVPATIDTQKLIGERELSKMKDGSFLINYSRGDVVDIDALVSFIEKGKILGAAIDVFPEEPESVEDTFKSPLQGFDNVILSPHVGGSTQEAQENIGFEVAEKLTKYHTSGITKWAVNFPEVSAKAQEGSHRIIHIHANQPGILGHITEIVSAKGVNILGQHLQTSTDIGFMLIDIEQTPACGEIMDEFNKIEGTIKARMLY